MRRQIDMVAAAETEGMCLSSDVRTMYKEKKYKILMYFLLGRITSFIPAAIFGQREYHFLCVAVGA